MVDRAIASLTGWDRPSRARVSFGESEGVQIVSITHRQTGESRRFEFLEQAQ